jgi:hypothetical protein
MRGVNRIFAETCQRAESRCRILRPRAPMSSLLAVDKYGRESHGAFSAFAPSMYMAKCNGRTAIRRSSCSLVLNASRAASNRRRDHD